MNDRRTENQERLIHQESHRDPHWEEEILADPQASEEFYAALDLDQELKQAAPRTALRLAPPKLAWATGLAAAVLVVAILLPRFSVDEGGPEPTMRNGSEMPAAIGVQPQGPTSNFPRVFTWHPGTRDGERRYRWELYDSEARRRSLAVVADTVLTRPATATPTDSLGTWRWLVVELLPDGREGATSTALEFKVTGAEK